MTTMTRDQAIEAATAPGEPYELVDALIAGRRLRIFRNAPPSLRAVYEATATDLPFLVYEGERLSFAQAWAEASRIGHVLVHACGVRPGDRVAISMRNYPEWMLAFTAITSIGAVAVAMNAHWQSEEMGYGLQDCGAKVLFADAERVERFLACDMAGSPSAPAVVAVRCDGAEGIPTLDALLAEVGDVPMPPAGIDPDADAIIFYTSGSTGYPKGVVSSHRNVLSALLSWELDGTSVALTSGAEPEALPYQHATLLAIPLFHVTGSHAVFLMSYRLQRRMVSMYKWDPALAAEIVEREKITTFVAPPAMTGDLVQEAKRTSRDLTTLQTVGGGGAARAPEQVHQIAAAFAKALPNTGWGMTETNAIGAWITGTDYVDHAASSGRCSAVLELKVVDADGTALPANERGELLVRGTSVFRCYWNRPELEATTFEDGWFRTGDVACIDDEGYLFIVDRIKDLIIRGGENIGTGKVESVLLAHPDVLECAVYAVPDERLGEEVGATVYGTPSLDVDALRSYLADHLARFEVPRYFTVAPEPLPRTASGKILKRQLRDEAASLHG